VTTPTTPTTPTPLRALRAPVCWWLLLLTVGLMTRPPIPIDETRYLAVAWEMWQRGDLLVPHLLGEPYAHKPPLLFWGMHLGWWLFGVSDWWARLVAPLFGLATLVLAVRTAAWWWPARPGVMQTAPWLLVGALFWSVFATLTMFDLLVAASALAGALGLALAAMRGQRRGFLLAGVAIGVGLLAKGPVILLHVLPLAAAAPWWAGLPRERWWRWFGGCALALALGTAVALAWAVPASLRGGDGYANAILWHQSTGRITGAGGQDLNPHRHGWWWLLPFVPVLLFPWALWPPAWRALRRLPAAAASDPGIRWCLCWCGSVLLLHSLISGKQPHYLIPLVAPALLLLARLFDESDRTVTRRDHWPVVAVLAIVCLALLVAPRLDPAILGLLSAGNSEAAPQAWGPAIGLLPGLVATALTITFIALPATTQLPAIRRLAITGILLLVALHLCLMEAVRPAYDVTPMARRIGAWQDQGIAVARIAPYRGEYQFLGRLTAAPSEIALRDLPAWTRAHPTGMVLMTMGAKRPLPRGITPPDEEVPFRGMRLGIWRADRMLWSGEDD
jgi:4-amino-4-deoxy-L-arabinose transferase-like glycosyltransferase